MVPPAFKKRSEPITRGGVVVNNSMVKGPEHKPVDVVPDIKNPTEIAIIY
jgi:hypothetical protein